MESPSPPSLLNLYLLFFFFYFLSLFFGLFFCDGTDIAQNIATYILKRLVLPSASNAQAAIRLLSNHAHHIIFAPFLLPAVESVLCQTSRTAPPTIH